MLCYYAECRILFIILPNAIMLNVIMLSVVMLNVVLLSSADVTKHFFVSGVRAFFKLKYLKGVSLVLALALLANIRLGCKPFTGRNTPAYLPGVAVTIKTAM
jgi:hypothetical protein